MSCRFLSKERKVHYFRKCIFFYQYQNSIKYTDTLLTPKHIQLEIPLVHKKIDIAQCPVAFGKLIQCTYSLQVTLEFGTIITEEPDLQMPLYVTLQEESKPISIEESKSVRLSRDMQ